MKSRKIVDVMLLNAGSQPVTVQKVRLRTIDQLIVLGSDIQTSSAGPLPLVLLPGQRTTLMWVGTDLDREFSGGTYGDPVALEGVALDSEGKWHVSPQVLYPYTDPDERVG